jgi:hypothetical protein
MHAWRRPWAHYHTCQAVRISSLDGSCAQPQVLGLQGTLPPPSAASPDPVALTTTPTTPTTPPQPAPIPPLPPAIPLSPPTTTPAVHGGLPGPAGAEGQVAPSAQLHVAITQHQHIRAHRHAGGWQGWLQGAVACVCPAGDRGKLLYWLMCCRCGVQGTGVAHQALPCCSAGLPQQGASVSGCTAQHAYLHSLFLFLMVFASFLKRVLFFSETCSVLFQNLLCSVLKSEFHKLKMNLEIVVAAQSFAALPPPWHLLCACPGSMHRPTCHPPSTLRQLLTDSSRALQASPAAAAAAEAGPTSGPSRARPYAPPPLVASEAVGRDSSRLTLEFADHKLERTFA